MTEEDRKPIVATYLIKVVIRGDETAEDPTNTQVEDAIVEAIASIPGGYASVTAQAERTDR